MLIKFSKFSLIIESELWTYIININYEIDIQQKIKVLNKDYIIMKILALTDIHGETEKLKKVLLKDFSSNCDLILVAGDLTNFGDKNQISAVINLLNNSNKPYFYVPGNCDYVNRFDQEQLKYNLHGKHVVYSRIGIIGIGGSLKTPFNTPFEITEEEIDRLLRSAYQELIKFKNFDKWILVSHNPPYNTSLDYTRTGLHVGSKIVRKFIEDNKPILVITGHVHEARSKDKLGETLVVNPGPLKDNYYAEIEIKNDVQVELKSL